MTIPEKAVQFMADVANDNSHGYDQSSRWGPDYDCSSLVITAYEKAGVPVKSSGATYTGNMYSVFLSNGFKDVTSSVNLVTGSGMQPGDVLLNDVHHTAMYIGSGQLAQASINERGGVTGGKTGDQTGGEINIHSYYNFPWDHVLRYSAKDSNTPSKPDTNNNTEHPNIYTVQQGDTLWGIAARFLGAGERYVQIMSANNLITDMIHPGQKLVIPYGNPSTVYRTIQVTISSDTLELLTIMAEGWDKTIGQVIDALMEDAV